jgi:translation initiation factor 2B subunit (eIF-2B alpha/beta/delta family)
LNYGANNKSIQIFCSESRPKNEGILLAEKLGKQNVATTLVTDSYLFSKIHHADIVLIGADAISNKGVINKMGSRPLIQLAMQYNVPRFVLCSTDKILPSGYHMNEESLKSADQITKVSIPNVNLINKYFDNTPLDLFDGIVTEKGIFSSKDITLIMDKLLIHDRLKSI